MRCVPCYAPSQVKLVQLVADEQKRAEEQHHVACAAADCRQAACWVQGWAAAKC